MLSKAAKPRRVTYSESLNRFVRLKKNFAVKPFGSGNDKWDAQRVLAIPPPEAVQENQKRLIRDVNEGVAGLGFAAEEFAKIIRGWMAQDD